MTTSRPRPARSYRVQHISPATDRSALKTVFAQDQRHAQAIFEEANPDVRVIRVLRG